MSEFIESETEMRDKILARIGDAIFIHDDDYWSAEATAAGKNQIEILVGPRPNGYFEDPKRFVVTIVRD